MNGLIPQETVAELFGIEVRTLRQWRTSDFKGTKKYLHAIRDTATSKSYYAPEELIQFLERNEEYRDKVLAALSPMEAQNKLLPRSSQIQMTPLPDYSWWLSHNQTHKENPNDHPHT